MLLKPFLPGEVPCGILVSREDELSVVPLCSRFELECVKLKLFSCREVEAEVSNVVLGLIDSVDNIFDVRVPFCHRPMVLFPTNNLPVPNAAEAVIVSVIGDKPRQEHADE